MLITTGTIARNKKASFNFFLEEKFEAGISLLGSEVKSLREGRVSINESYVSAEDGSLFLVNANIQEYSGSSFFQHKPTRPRRLLLHKQQLKKLLGAVAKKGYTIVPLSLYFNNKGIAKLEIALATGKKNFDKRETEKTRDWNRDKQRILMNRNKKSI